MIVAIFSVLIILTGLFEGAMMNLGFFPFITIGGGILMLIGSFFRKRNMNLTTTIISFILYSLSHGYIFLDMMFSYGISSSPYFILTLIIFVLPVVFFICALIATIKKGKKAVAKAKKKNVASVSTDFVFCPNCGSKQKKGTRFCGSCGTSCETLISAREYDKTYSRK